MNVTPQESSKKYYQKNREAILARVKEYAATHPEVNQKATARWREDNRDSERERAREYRNTELGKLQRRIVQSFRNKTLAAGTFNETQWLQLKADTGNKCLACGKPESEVILTVDHITPLSKGGINELSNVQPLCWNCNVNKFTQVIDYRGRQIL